MLFFDESKCSALESKIQGLYDECIMYYRPMLWGSSLTSIGEEKAKELMEKYTQINDEIRVLQESREAIQKRISEKPDIASGSIGMFAIPTQRYSDSSLEEIKLFDSFIEKNVGKFAECERMVGYLKEHAKSTGIEILSAMDFIPHLPKPAELPYRLPEVNTAMAKSWEHLESGADKSLVALYEAGCDDLAKARVYEAEHGTERLVESGSFNQLRDVIGFLGKDSSETGTRCYADLAKQAFDILSRFDDCLARSILPVSTGL